METNIYITTSLHGPAKQNGTCLYVVEHGGETRTRKGRITKISANSAEAVVLAAALQRAQETGWMDNSTELHVYVETEYAASALRGRLQKWKELGWCNQKGRQLANLEAWQQIEQLTFGKNLVVHQAEHHAYSEWMKFTLKTEKKD